jgi:hypothetical protein
MPAPELLLDLYLSLAEVAEPRPQERESFLTLAASAAELAGQEQAAEACRAEILRLNPQHFLGGFDSMGEALQSDDVIERTEALYRTYHFERAEFLLERHRHPEQADEVPADADFAAESEQSGGPRTPASVRAMAAPRRVASATVEAFPRLQPLLRETSFAEAERQVPLGAAIVLAIVAFAVGFLACGTLQLVVK